jgi:parvulin-like peptidyl-prolyl isomerase
MQIFKELSMADIMRNDSMFVPQTPSEESIRAYYDAHPEEYAIPARAHVYEILLSDEMLAAKLAKSIASIRDFQEKAMDLTERPGKRTSNGELGWVERTWFPEIFDAAWKTNVGAIGGPVATQGKYSIFYVADKMEARMKDYIAVKREIAAKISADKKKEMYTQWLADRRAKTDVEVYEDALWSTIDKNKYAATSGTEAPKTN